MTTYNKILEASATKGRLTLSLELTLLPDQKDLYYTVLVMKKNTKDQLVQVASSFVPFVIDKGEGNYFINDRVRGVLSQASEGKAKDLQLYTGSSYKSEQAAFKRTLVEIEIINKAVTDLDLIGMIKQQIGSNFIMSNNEQAAKITSALKDHNLEITDLI